MPRVLITGASGLLGGNLLYLLPQTWEILGLANHAYLNPSFARINVRRANLFSWKNEIEINAFLHDFEPAVIIHCAALTNVDKCEIDRAEAHELHVEVTKSIAAYSASNNVHLVHISTDHIFDGEKGGYAETDQPQPLNYYAQTKWEAEQAVLESGAEAAIVRTIFFFGFNVQEK